MKKFLGILAIIALLAVPNFMSAQTEYVQGTININILEGVTIDVDILDIFFDPPAMIGTSWENSTTANPTVSIAWNFTAGVTPRVFIKVNGVTNDGHELNTLGLFSYSARNGWTNGTPLMSVLSGVSGAATNIYTSNLNAGTDVGEVEFDLDASVLGEQGPLEAGTYTGALAFFIAAVI